MRLVDNAQDLVDDVFADPQRLNPGNIWIIRTLVTPNPRPADCGAAAPLNCDVAVFANPIAEYDFAANANGTITVFDNPAKAQGGHLLTGTDTLRNIERLRFSDTEVDAPVFNARRVVPLLIGLSQAQAIAALQAVRIPGARSRRATARRFHRLRLQPERKRRTDGRGQHRGRLRRLARHRGSGFTGLTELRAQITLSEAGR